MKKDFTHYLYDMVDNKKEFVTVYQQQTYLRTSTLEHHQVKLNKVWVYLDDSIGEDFEKPRFVLLQSFPDDKKMLLIRDESTDEMKFVSDVDGKLKVVVTKDFNGKEITNEIERYVSQSYPKESWDRSDYWFYDDKVKVVSDYLLRTLESDELVEDLKPSMDKVFGGKFVCESQPSWGISDNDERLEHITQLNPFVELYVDERVTGHINPRWLKDDEGNWDFTKVNQEMNPICPMVPKVRRLFYLQKKEKK